MLVPFEKQACAYTRDYYTSNSMWFDLAQVCRRLSGDIPVAEAVGDTYDEYIRE